MKCYILSMNCEQSAPDFVKWRTDQCVESCVKMGYDFEIFYGPTPFNGKATRLKQLLGTPKIKSGTDCCSLSHLFIQRRLRLAQEKAVIMEYDSYWVRPIDFDLPDDETINLCGEPRGVGYYVGPKQLNMLLKEQKRAGILAPADWVLNKEWHVHRKEYNHRCDVQTLCPEFMANYKHRLADKAYIWYDQAGHVSIRRGHRP